MTFLFTDVEGSTRRWEADADEMRTALVVHDKVLRTVIEAYDGFLFSHTGDGLVAAFAPPMSGGLERATRTREAPDIPVPAWHAGFRISVVDARGVIDLAASDWDRLPR